MDAAVIENASGRPRLRMVGWVELVRLLLSVAFLWAGFMKFLGGGDPTAFVPLGLQYGTAVVELAVGASLVLFPGPWAGRAALTIALAMVSFAFARSLSGVDTDTCGCLGRAVQLDDAQQLAAAGGLALMAAIVGAR